LSGFFMWKRKPSTTKNRRFVRRVLEGKKNNKKKQIRIDSRSARTKESKETRKRGAERTKYVSTAQTKVTQESDVLSCFEIALMVVVGTSVRVGRRFANETAEFSAVFYIPSLSKLITDSRESKPLSEIRNFCFTISLLIN
ncbi:hypothetical protein U5N28_14450, partial [Lysinibacillus telephonicus]|uniref:hypothetical protein n=1 Tax=Lysinibacillus telephonicus TaxID=1714840 RepID=UPI0039786E2F